MLQARLLRADQALEPTLDSIRTDAGVHPRCASELARRKPHLVRRASDLDAAAGDTAATLLLRYGMAEWAGARNSEVPPPAEAMTGAAHDASMFRHLRSQFGAGAQALRESARSSHGHDPAVSKP
jgi:hypothetical protein